MTDHYGKSAQAIFVPKTAASHVVLVILVNGIMSKGIQNTVMTDNVLQFVSKIFAALYAYVDTNMVAATEYQPQASVQVERFNKTLVERQKHYIGEHQTDRDSYVQPLTCSYSTKAHRNRKTYLLNIVLIQKPPGAIKNEETRTS